MIENKIMIAVLTGLLVTTGVTGWAQTKASPATQATTASAANVVKITNGIKHKTSGVILRRDADTFILRDMTKGEVTVVLTGTTKVTEKKSNIFRAGKNYGTTNLVQGLSVEVEGRGDSNGSLVADKIRFTDNALIAVQAVDTRVTPVEGRVVEAENRISEAEANAQRLSGQMEEIKQISNTTREGVKAAQSSANDAQKTANAAVAGVDATNRRIDQIVSQLDDFETSRGITVNFKVGSAKLQPEATAALDEIAAQAKTAKAYLIEITGYASADGNQDTNRKLSQQRADAVVRYLAENHMIPLRRMITPFGYGAAQPVADNKTKEGREQNRRVEVKILINKGIAAPTPAVKVARPNGID